MNRRPIHFAVLVCILATAVTTQAQLFDPPIDNPSFEAQDLGDGGGGQWADFAEEWVINAQGNCYLEDGTWEIAAPDGVATLKMWNGAAIWQQIGTWRPNTDYGIGLFIGRGLNTADVQVELWAGGNAAFVPGSGFGAIGETVGATLIGGAPLVPSVPMGENEWMSLTLNTGAGFNPNDPLWLRIESTGEAAWVDLITVESLVDPAIAHHPNPSDWSDDIVRDGAVSWTPGIFAQKHDVYFGTNLDDVTHASRANPLDVLVSTGQDANTYDFGKLAFGQTYFWRADEVNAPPSSTIYKGDVWSFTVEPYSVKVPASNIGVTASSVANDISTPETTIDGSGLDANDMHDIDSDTMWFSDTGDQNPWIQFEFSGVQKLDMMKIWNANSSAESAIGWGIKEVQVEYSEDGENWSVLPGVDELNRAPGTTTYAAYDEIACNNVLAKTVRLNIQSNWGGLLQQYGVSEVQFYAIPTRARTPEPASGSVDVQPSAIIEWRAGREAVEHVIYVGTDAGAVADGTALSVTSPTNSLDLASLDIQLGQTYSWRVDEVNEAETLATWPGDIWTFTLQKNLVVDDFESYNGIPVDQEGSHRVYMIWEDGYAGDPAQNGSTMGLLTGNFLDGNDMHGGAYSVPYFYDNRTASMSEVVANTRDLPIGSDWSLGAPEALVLWLRGDAGNDPAKDQLYVKVDNAKVTYTGDISLPQWSQWAIDLADLGIDLTHVSTIKIGFERTGASGGNGKVLFDDIMLYGEAPNVLRQPDPEDNLTVNASLETPDFGASGNGAWADFVLDWVIDSQGSAYLEDGTWDIVAPDGVATLKMWDGAGLWQQIGNVSPNTDYQVTLFAGRGHATSAVQVELWAGGNPALVPDSFGTLDATVGATLIGGGPLTPTIAIGQSELMGITLNTGPDFGPQDALWVRIVSTSGAGAAVWVDSVMVTIPPQNLTVNPSLETPDWTEAGAGQWADNVDDWIVNVQGNCYLEDGTWQIVAPDGLATLKMWDGGAIWQQIGTVQPNTDYEISLFVGRGDDTTAVQVELWAGGDPAALPASFGIIGDTVGATLIDGASLTPTIAVGQSELMDVTINTGGSFGTQDALWVRIQSTSGAGKAAWVDNVTVITP